MVVLALDAGDPGLVREWAAVGELPAIARLLAEGTAAPVQTPIGVSAAANWPSIFTALEPDRHGYLGGDEIDPTTYAHRATSPSASTVHGTPLWERLSQAGRRSVVIDVPQSWGTPIDGQLIVEWDGHEEAGPVRTLDEEQALLVRLRASVERKREESVRLFAQDDWEVFLTVFGEGRCVGHQLWHQHDPQHPRHDPAARRTLGGDPVLDIYRRIDAAFAEHLALLRPDDTVYLLLPYGMAAHVGGTDVLDPLLARLDVHLDTPDAIGRATRLVGGATRPLPSGVRRQVTRLAAPLVRRRAEAAPPATTAELPARAERRWFAVPNHSASGAVRLNLAGREGAGRIDPAARTEVLAWLANRLREVVNIDTGKPMVGEVVVTDDVYRRHDGDLLADLYVEWTRDAPIERVWSPEAGTIVRPQGQGRTGGDLPGGLIVARGPGIAAGATAGPLRSVDVGATLAVASGVELVDVDGHAVAALLPAGVAGGVRRHTMVHAGRSGARRSLATLESAGGRRGGRAPGARWEAVASSVVQPPADVSGLAGAHHETRAMLLALTDRVSELEREATIARTAAWVRQQPLASTQLVSVITPTHNRRELVLQAIASVEAQSYPHWEMLVIDDGSTDGTAEVLAKLEDPRVRCYTNTGVGSASARNIGLENATGSLIVYLDDDNRFDPDWLKAVAWTFEDRPDTQVAYGARLIDDTGRHHGTDRTGLVGLQLLHWDRPAALQANLVDMNVLAHRVSPARFDPQLVCFVDWDLLLTLTAEAVPVEIPVVAACYTTTAPERLSEVLPPDDVEWELGFIRTKHAPQP